MTEKAQHRLWSIVDDLEDVAIELDIMGTDLKKYPSNDTHWVKCRRLMERLRYLASVLEVTANSESK